MNKKTNIILTIVVSIIAICLVVFCIIKLNQKTEAKGDGIVTIEYIDETKTSKVKKEIAFYNGDTLAKILEENFNNVVISKSGTSIGMITSFEDFNTPSDWSKFIMIYIDGVMTSQGVNKIELKDGQYIVVSIDIYDPNYSA